MELFFIGALALLLLLFISKKSGKTEKELEQNEELLDEIKESKAIRDSVNNKSVRGRLRKFLNEQNK